MSYGLGAKINSRYSLLREIAFLKKLKPSFMWRGELVHGIMADVLKRASRSKITKIETAKDLLKKRAGDQWDDSKRRALRADPRTSLRPEGPILMEHYYRDLDNGLDLNEVVESAQQQLRNLYSWIDQQGLFEQVVKARKVWIEPALYLSDSPGFMVDDVRFVAKVDMALLTSENFKIFDWKTSNEPKGEFQLSHEHRQASFYAIWPHLEMGHPVEGIEIAVVYVGGTEPNAHNFKVLPHHIDDLLADAELLVRASREYLNVENRFGLEDFDWATSARACYWCPFQQICQRELG